MLRETLSPEVARCRVRGSGIVIELDPDCLESLGADRQADLAKSVRLIFTEQGATDIQFAAYRRGSTFLTETLND